MVVVVVVVVAAVVVVVVVLVLVVLVVVKFNVKMKAVDLKARREHSSRYKGSVHGLTGAM